MTSITKPWRSLIRALMSGCLIALWAMSVSGALAEESAAEPLVFPEDVARPNDAATDAGTACCVNSGCENCLGGCGGCGCAMREVCCCTLEKGTVDKYCWKVGCEKVCIPPVCLPKCCSWLPFGCCGNCAACRIRCVNTLEKHDYECTQCQCQWKVGYVPCFLERCSCRPGCECYDNGTSKQEDVELSIPVSFEQQSTEAVESSGQPRKAAHWLWSWARRGSAVERENDD